MFPSEQYHLVDFGDGRKLERFGPYGIDRPCAAAGRHRPARPGAWANAVARYDGPPGRPGHWSPAGALPQRWTVSCGPIHLELAPTATGQLGIFPEQAPCWDWIARQVAAAGRPLRVLNLFAYTGGSTLAAAAAGAQVVHVDAARSAVGWARRNARCSGLADAPIRWIAEDAGQFVQRELRRSHHYDAVILDPPSYGHGPRGQPWKLAEHLPPLLQMCAELTAERRAFILLTCHSPGFGPAVLARELAARLPGNGRPRVEAGLLQIASTDGRELPSGAFARWTTM